MARSGTFAAPAGYRDSPNRALNNGEVVASTYAIKDEILRTEDGVVFEAKDMVLDRIVAFKLAWRDPGTPSLMPEARRCAAVRDACAVQVHGMGMHNGAEYVVGERVVGRLLREELREPLTHDVFLARQGRGQRSSRKQHMVLVGQGNDGFSGRRSQAVSDHQDLVVNLLVLLHLDLWIVLRILLEEPL